MNSEVKEEWIAELTSGNYNQGKGRLTYKEGDKEYDCCLGVLCKIAVKHGVIDAPNQTDSRTRIKYGPEEQTTVLPKVVAEWAGISETGALTNNLPGKNGPYDSDDYAEDNDALSAANDDGYTFDEIAAVIDEQF